MVGICNVCGLDNGLSDTSGGFDNCRRCGALADGSHCRPPTISITVCSMPVGGEVTVTMGPREDKRTQGHTYVVTRVK